MKKKVIIAVVIGLVIILMTMPVSAATEPAKGAVETVEKAESAGNLFIWFLCALAFLKVSQKIDSFMGALGINVARTGGNMLSEMIIAAKTVGVASKGVGKAIGGKGGLSGGVSSGGSGGSGGFFSGGLAGVVSRQFSNSTVKNVTGQGSSGIGGTVTQAAYQTSLKSGGSFATSVISQVAHGDISQTGVIKGKEASDALGAYISSPNNSTQQISSSIQSSSTSTGTISPSSTTSTANSISQSVASKYAYKNVEIGGGRITGTEIPILDNPVLSRTATNSIPASADMIGNTGTEAISSITSGSENNSTSGEAKSSVGASPAEPRQFAMYSTDKYSQPSGDFSTVVSKDGASWYKQYAEPFVKSTPFRDLSGEIKYNKEIIEKMPPPPPRKDRL